MSPTSTAWKRITAKAKGGRAADVKAAREGIVTADAEAEATTAVADVAAGAGVAGTKPPST